MTRYQLSIHAERLPRGIFRKPNPVAVVTVTGGPREGEEIGRTDVVENSLDPEFTRVLFVETDSSVFLPLKVSIYNDRNDALLADATFEATEVAVAKGHLQEQQCRNGAKYVDT
jgi:C2 domain